jgi:hypothetical protein
MKRKTHLTLLVAGLLFVTAATASAQSSIQLVGTAGSYGAAARAGTEVDFETVQYGYACTGAVLDYEYPYPLTVLVYLYANGILQDWGISQGTFYAEVTTDTYFVATPYDQPVDCYVYTTHTDLYVGDVAPGLPDGESSEFTGWVDDTIGRFYGHLSPANGDYANTTVREHDPGGGWDACWFPESEVLKFDKVTAPDWRWPVSGNSYGPDYVGWFANAVLYYRAYDRAPCAAEFPQEMIMQVPGTNVLGPFEFSYKVNWLAAEITQHTVSTYRDGVWDLISWPF